MRFMRFPTPCALIVALAVVSAGMVRAQDAPASEDFHQGEVLLGITQTDVDTISSKFQEYREVPEGVSLGVFRLKGEKDGLSYDVFGQNVRQRDQRYRLRLQKDWLRVDGDYNQIPHNFGNGGRTLLQQTGPGAWSLSNTLQQRFQDAIAAVPRSTVNFTFLNNLVAPSLASANLVDLSLQRERGNLSFRVAPDNPVDVKVTYFRERRTGDRAASGTSFGFGNVVELPEPLHYLTQDIGADAQYQGSWGVVRAGLHYNWFENRIESFAFDNPFRATDSTDASAYTAPGSGSIGGPSVGLMSLPPDNDAWRGSIGGTFKLPSQTRVAVDVAIGRWMQNESPFIPFSTNTAITSPVLATDVATLPAPRLDGKINVTSLSLFASSRPVDNVTLSARYRSFDLENKTPRIAFPEGYVRFDAVFEDIPRISVPYGYKNQRFDLTAAYDFGQVSLEGGFRHTKFDRTFRETDETSENAVSVAGDLHVSDWVMLRASYERGSRDFTGYEPIRSEEASFLEAGPPANLMAVEGNLRYDQAKKDTDRIGTLLQLSPGGNATISLSYLRTKDDYKETAFGLQSASYDTLTAEVDYSPGERWNLYAFYSYEKVADFQIGRQSGATVSTNPLDNWTSDVNDKVNSVGAGAEVTLVPEKWFLSLLGRYQKVDGNNDLFADPTGVPGRARAAVGGVQDLPFYDDTKITTLQAEVKYQFAKSWSGALGGWFEDYEINDLNTQGLVNYVPGSFFLNENQGDYQAKVAYVRFSYRW
jgi:MtrB/PioB family decaheme-associated outer membrane protein